MSYAVSKYFDEFIRKQVESGRYNNPTEVLEQGLRLVEEREAKLVALKNHIEAAIERGGSFTDEEVAEAIENS